MARHTTEKGAMARHVTVKTLPRTVSVMRGGETKKGEFKGNTGAKIRETCQEPPVYHRHMAGGGL